MNLRGKIPPLTRRYAAEQNGAAAVEFALILALLILPVLNAVDFAIYAWNRMQVDNAAQVGAQAARANCTYNQQPATVNCIALDSAVKTAVRSTPLGSNVSYSIQEHYYCTVGGALKNVADPPNAPPANCGQNGIGGSSNDKPQDYVQVTTTYTYVPAFTGISIVGLLPSPIVRTAWMSM